MAAERSPYSVAWPRVAALKPRLRSDAAIYRQVFRGQLWYVVQDPASGRFHRLSPPAYTLVGLMDGRRSLQSVWEQAGRTLGDDLPTQDECIQLLAQLHQADLLITDVPPDVLEIAGRARTQERRGRLARVANPLAVRFPLLDPDRFLKAAMPVVGPLYSTAGFLAWLAVVAWAAILAGMHWPELTGNLTDRVMSTGNLLVLVLVFPFVKAIHELSHGFAARKWDGEVHEMGIMLLVLMPIPYVDASAASAFREKWRRVVVGAAGMLAEVLLAAFAMIVWSEAEPGIVRAVAFNVMVIASVSTVLFNGNPLLRYDGYYMLADFLEIPNLATRSSRYLGYLVQRYLFGVRHLESPAAAPGERGWFVFYGIASFLYRLFVWTAIVLLVASKLFFVGVVLAAWGAFMMFLRPLGKNLGYLVTSPVLAAQRGRALTVTLAILALAVGGLFLVPVPRATVVEGVVWPPERSVVRAGADGFVAAIDATPGTGVAAGQALLRLEDPILLAKVRALEAELAQLELTYAAQRATDFVQAEVTRQAREYAEANLARAREQVDALTIQSEVAGRLVLPQAEDLEGRFVEKGTIVAYVLQPDDVHLQVVLTQDDVDPVRSNTRGVTVRLAGRVGERLDAERTREVPAATWSLPSRALSTDGGGRIFLDPRDPGSGRTLQAVFQLELTLPEGDAGDFIGRRAWVRFDHGLEPLPARWYRGLRQLFLRRFGV